MTAQSFHEIIAKYNPYHDNMGRFSTADAHTSFSLGGTAAQRDKAIAREKERSGSSGAAAGKAEEPKKQTREQFESKLRDIGSLWEKNGMSRVYFNNLEERVGLTVDYYRSGNVRQAWLDGESLSNSNAKRYLSELGSGKFWYDNSTGKFFHKGMDTFAVKIRDSIIAEAGGMPED